MIRWENPKKIKNRRNLLITEKSKNKKSLSTIGVKKLFIGLFSQTRIIFADYSNTTKLISLKR